MADISEGSGSTRIFLTRFVGKTSLMFQSGVKNNALTIYHPGPKVAGRMHPCKLPM